MSDLPESAIDLIGEGSAHSSQLDKYKLDWLLNLDVDHDTAVYQAATPVSVQSTIPSTPALPVEVIGSDHTVSPPRFSPEPEDELAADQGTVSDKTYDAIRKLSYFRFSLDFFFFFFLLPLHRSR